MRDPANPATVGAGNERASRYKGTYWYEGNDDNSGVHWNAGVQNHFFYLLCEGGSGNNDGLAYNLTGLGVASAEQIAYRALAFYCTPDTDYPAARSAWLSAAQDLNPAWVAPVAAAWSAVGVGPLTISPSTKASFRGLEGGPFLPAARTYTLANGDLTSVNWTASASQPWVTVSPASGAIAADGAANIQISINAAANALARGLYSAEVTFTNVADGLTWTIPVELNSGATDYFTELFDAADNDLDNMSLMFIPDGSPSYYTVERSVASTFPASPSGGTALDLADDDFAEATLTDGAQVSLYGTAYNRFYIGSNGYLTFGQGEWAFYESIAKHFVLPRVAALFDDLDPASGGAVSWKQMSDRAVVTWQNVPQYGMSGANSFQIELFFDGRIRITWLGISATDGLAGFSEGEWLPAGFFESDLSAYNAAITDDLELITYGGLVGSGMEGGPFTPASKTYTLRNNGAAPVDWTATPSAPWLTATPSNGTLDAGQIGRASCRERV